MGATANLNWLTGFLVAINSMMSKQKIYIGNLEGPQLYVIYIYICTYICRYTYRIGEKRIDWFPGHVFPVWSYGQFFSSKCLGFDDCKDIILLLMEEILHQLIGS